VLGPSGDFAKTDLVDWLNTFNVNIFGCAKIVHYFLKNNLIRKNGKIIIISGGISAPDPYFTSFSATKYALNGFVHSLSYQLVKKKIWVNSILPGSFNTKMNEIRIDRGPESIGIDNFKLSLSRINKDETKQYQKLHHLVEFLCSSISDGIYGRLISAQYDDWQNNIERLKNEKDDLYKIIRKNN
jgi:3-oxoacyl-[acyl-carrier protein] reductase